ncbi:MAG: Ig-like domain-containing protein [Thermoanaerobaculia bacterium]
MRALLIAFLLIAGTAEAATVTFVSPLPGSQAIGPLAIEVSTDAANVDRVEFSVDGKLAGVARTKPYRIAHDFGTALDAHEVTAKVFSNGYRTVDSANVRTAALTAGESISVDLVEVPLRVRSSQRLRTDDLRVEENGVAQTIRDIQADRGPASFVFVVDRSLSMSGGRLAEALRAIDGERTMLRAGDTASIIFFNHNVSKPRPIEAGESVAGLFRDVPPSGGTSLRDAVASIAPRQRTYVIVITDGGDRNSELSEEAALRRVSGTKTTIDALTLGSGSSFLEKAAKNTGGVVIEVDRGAIQRALHTLLADINSRYTVVYQSNASAPGWRSISVRPRRSGVSIAMARKGYFAQ